MLSRLDAIFKTQLRQTESTDTRQAIQRRDPDQRRRKDTKNPEDPFLDFQSDDITISLRAVRDILEQLLHKPAMDFRKTASSDSTATAAPDGTSNTKTETDNNALTGVNTQQVTPQAAAAQAYQRTWETAHPEDNIYTPTKENLPEIILSAEEMRTMNTLMDNIDTLLAHNHLHITMEKADTFLQALKNAVDAAMNALDTG